MVTCIAHKKGRVISIAVDPVYRHKGVGSDIVNFTFNQLKTSFIRTAELEVRITNSEGICFWKSFGFSPLIIFYNYYLDGTDALRKYIILYIQQVLYIEECNLLVDLELFGHQCQKKLL